MKIAVDFDNTLVKTSEKIKEYMLKNNISEFINNEKYHFYCKYVDDITKELELKDYAKEVLDKLSVNNEIYIITARSNYYSNNLKELTKEFIKKNNLPIKDIYFDCFQEGKANKCVELGIDLFIDDNVENCLYVNNKNIKTLLFENKHDNLITVNSWKEVLKYIKE